MRLYKNLLQDKTNDMAFVTLVDGKPEYYFEGYKINELRHVSNAAKVDGNNDAFIAFTPKGNIQIALESAAPSIAPFIQDAKSRNTTLAQYLQPMQCLLLLNSCNCGCTLLQNRKANY